MTARVRLVLFAGVALVLAGPVLAFFLGRLILSHDALLLDHVAERRSTLVELSLWAGADPNYRDDDGRSALPVAVELGDSEIVPLLLDAGADPNATDGAGIAVVVSAVVHGDAEMVHVLLNAGADPNGPGIAELVQRSGNADLLESLEAGALTAESLLTLAELGLNAVANIDTLIEGMICIFTLGFGC